MKKIFLLSVLSAIFLFSCRSEMEFNNGKEVIETMHKRYNGKWYKTLTFSQGVEQFKNDSLVNKEVWHEAYSAPSKLIIKFRSMTSGNGYIFNEDSLHIFAHHKLAASRQYINHLVLLGFDVYNQSVEETVAILEKVGYDLTKISHSEFDGKNVYVIGLETQDEKKSHFLIDKETLTFVKAVNFYQDTKKEVEFKAYKTIEGNLVATEVYFYTNEKLDMTEKYYNIKFPESIEDSVFDKNKFLQATW